MIGWMRRKSSESVRRVAPGNESWISLAILLIGGVVVALIGLTTIMAAQHSAGWGYDFRAYYDAALRLMATGTPYQDLTLSGPFQPGPANLYLYTPVPALLIVPLTWLGPETATLTWLAIRLGLLFGACVLMPVPRWVKAATLGICFISSQFLLDLNLGNVSLIVTFFAVVAWRWLDRPISGVAIAASMTIRPAMGAIWLWWIVRRQWVAVAWTVLGALAIFVASLPFIGLDPWFQFVTVLRNLSDVNSVARNLGLGSTALALGASEPVANLALIGGYVLAIGAILLSLRRDREIGFSVTLMATLLLSPLMWDHYLTNLIVPGALVASRGRRWGVLLPLLGWLPLLLLPLVAIVGMLVPFLAPDREERALGVTADDGQPVTDLDASPSSVAGA
jgi:hypothetical protein